jgi:hypothetical protein
MSILSGAVTFSHNPARSTQHSRSSQLVCDKITGDLILMRLWAVA